MESECFYEEKSSNSKNINYFDVQAKFDEKSPISKITASNSSHTTFKNFEMLNIPKRSKNVSLESLSREHTKVSRSSSVNKACDAMGVKNRNDPQFLKLPLNISSRIGAVQVLPTCIITANVNTFYHKSYLDSDIISMNNYCQSEMTVSHKNTSATNDSTNCLLNFSTSENDAISVLSLRDQEIDCILNRKIHTLSHLENNAMVNNTDPEYFQLENSVQSSILAITSDHDVQSCGKQGKEKIKCQKKNINIGFTHLQNQELPITADKKYKYLDNTVINGPNVSISREIRYLLSEKTKDTNVASEPLYEEIEDADNHYKTQNSQHIFTYLKDDDDKGHFRRSINDIRRQFESHEESERQRLESHPRKDTDSFDEVFKIEVSQLKDNEDDKNIDEVWIKHMDRPLLPLKTNLKQRSSSCTNLVQTLKIFSKRNSADNSRSLEITGRHLKHTMKSFNSEADISKDSQTEESQLKGIQPPRNSSIAESLETRNYTWYHQVDAREASRRLLDMEQDGVFLIRPASFPTKHVLHTLCVTYNGCVYNMYIRHLPNGFLALGKKKENEKIFSTVLEMIRYHQHVPISINVVQSNRDAYVYLLLTPPK